MGFDHGSPAGHRGVVSTRPPACVVYMAKKHFGKSPDAQFRFSMSEDGMKLGVSRYSPPEGGEGPSVDLIKRQVAAAGVTLPVDEVAAAKVVQSAQQGGEVRKAVLVRGLPATEPRDGSLMALGDLDYPVFPSDRFARKQEPVEARDGQTIDGRILHPSSTREPEDIDIEMGENVEYDAVTESYVARVWGLARFKDGRLWVDPLPKITEDAVFVRATLHHKDFRGEKITTARIEKEMRDLGVVIDIDSDDIENKLDKTRTSKKPLFDQVVVAGRHPVPGRDGWFEYLVSSREETGTEDESGRLDFRDRGNYPMVRPGQVIGRLHPPTLGQGGIDIYGKTIPASGGRELTIHMGENVAVHDDKETYESKAQGIVSMERNVLSVTDCLLISGNVDLNTGNVHVEHGSVKILGSVQAGFSVSAPKHVIVQGSVESATVSAGGSVEVSGGILMPEGGKLTAGGDVTASYTTNAIIEAGGDVHVANDITNSFIHADGVFYAVSGKGLVQGGRITSARGMVINEIGSDMGVETQIVVEIEHAEDEGLRQERKKVKDAIAKIDDALGTDAPQAILERTPPEKRAAVGEVLKHRITLVKRRKAISEHLNQLALERQAELAGIKIQVKRFVHPGSTIRFGAKRFSVGERTEASVVYWSESCRDIVFE